MSLFSLGASLVGGLFGGDDDGGGSSRPQYQFNPYSGNTQVEMPSIYDDLLSNVSTQLQGDNLGMSDEEIEIEKKRLIKALNVVGEKGWELVQSDDKVGFLFKKVK